MYLVYSLRAKIIYKPKLTLFTNNDIITRAAERKGKNDDCVEKRSNSQNGWRNGGQQEQIR